MVMNETRRWLTAAALMAAVACSSPSADEHAARADAYMAEKKLAEAAIEYRAAIQRDPTRGDLRLKLGELYMELQNGRAALDELVRAADLLPGNADAQMKAGSILLLAAQFEDAKARAEKVLAIDPKSPEGHVLLGNALAGLNDVDGAIKELQGALALNPDREGSLISMGAAQLRKGNEAEAETAFRKAVDVAPRSISSRLALANFLWSAGKPADAEEQLKSAVAIDPKNLMTNRAIGTFYLASNRAPEAEPYFKAVAEAASTPDAKLSLADYYAVVNRPDDAVRVLKELASADATFAAAMTRLAAIEAARGNRALALSQIRDVLQKHPTEAPARLLSARLLLFDNKQDEALAEAAKLSTEQPDSPSAAEAFFVVGRVHQNRGRYPESIAAYEEVLKRQPRPVGAALALSAIYLAQGQPEKAATFAQQALSLSPNLPEARALLVRIAFAKGDLAAARQTLAALQKEFPNSVVVLNLLGSQQLAEGKLAAARESFGKASSIATNDLEALAGLIETDLMAKNPQGAINRIEEALKRVTPSSGLLALAARAYAATGKADRAEEVLKQAIAAEPDKLQPYGMLASLYVGQRRIAEAQQQYRQLLAMNPRSVGNQTMLAMLLDHEKKYDEAAKEYEKALAIDPSAPVAANNLAWIYVASNRNMDQALDLARTAVRGLPEEPNVNDTIGWIYYKRDLIPDAVRHLEISVKNGPNAAGSHYHLGMAYLKAGDRQKARASLQKALSLSQTFDGVEEAKSTLASLGR